MNINQLIKQKRSKATPPDEKGLSMVIALMMGMVLIAGVTGLMLRQLMGRKLGAAESYQQMAETAALNGFNRILGELNADDDAAYKGYLFTLSHHSGDLDGSGSTKWGWNASNKADFPLRELCTDRSQLPDAVPASSSASDPPYVELTENTASQRNDGKANIQLQYRLRGYTTTATAENNGLGEGRFQIEGIVVRDGDDPAQGYLARTLLLRSLYVNSIVAGEGDWAVLAGPNLALGDAEILNQSGASGPGKVLLNVNSPDRYASPKGCLPSNLLEDVGADFNNDNLEGRVIPILKKGLPTQNLWDLGLTQDKQSGSDTVRIWSFDDTGSLESCESIACVRDSDTSEASERSDLQQEGNTTIRLSTDELCQGEGEDCHMFVEHINLTNTRLLIETSANRPVVVHLEYPGTSTKTPKDPGITGSINLGSGAQLCGVEPGSNTCNGRPEQLIILSGIAAPSGVRSCAMKPESHQYILAFDGDSLPHATVHMVPGFVKAGSSRTSLNGLIWADGICTNAGPFSLITETSGGSSVVRDLNQQWKWESKNFPGYGQMVTRGVRGTGLDTFRRW